MEKPLVSVVIPTFNAKKFLPKTIKSVLNQSYQSIEVIVIDDGSIDGTEDLPILKDSRVRYFKIKHTGGPATPRNVGIQSASGELIAFLDSDDTWLPEKLEKQVTFMQKSGFDFVSCDAIVVDERGRVAKESYLGDMSVPSGNVFPSLYEGNFVITSSVLVRRLCLESVGQFVRGLEGAEDYDLWLRTAARFRFGYLPRKLLVYRDRKRSHSDAPTDENYRVVFEVMHRNFGQALKTLGPRSKWRLFNWSRDLAARSKGKNFWEYVKYKGLAIRYLPFGAAGRRALWEAAKSVVEL